jgi:hypothetical protein
MGEWVTRGMYEEGIKELQTQLAHAMPVPRCDTCAWWKPHTTSGLFGDCTLFECHDKEQVGDISKVIVSRTDSGEATIITWNDFGCVQWKAK